MSTLTVKASCSADPQTSGVAPSARAELAVSFVVSSAGFAQHKVVLSADAPVSVPLPSGTNAVMLASKQGAASVRARLSTARGAQQAVPVAPVALLVFRGDALTALDLTREPGAETTVDVFLGVL